MDVVTAFDQKADDRDRVRDVKKDDTGRDHAVESRIASQIQQAQDSHNNAADKVRAERHIHSGIDVAEEFAKRQAAVASKGPA